MIDDTTPLTGKWGPANPVDDANTVQFTEEFDTDDTVLLTEEFDTDDTVLLTEEFDTDDTVDDVGRVRLASEWDTAGLIDENGLIDEYKNLDRFLTILSEQTIITPKKNTITIDDDIEIGDTVILKETGDTLTVMCIDYAAMEYFEYAGKDQHTGKIYLFNKIDVLRIIKSNRLDQTSSLQTCSSCGAKLPVNHNRTCPNCGNKLKRRLINPPNLNKHIGYSGDPGDVIDERYRVLSVLYAGYSSFSLLAYDDFALHNLMVIDARTVAFNQTTWEAQSEFNHSHIQMVEEILYSSLYIIVVLQHAVAHQAIRNAVKSQQALSEDQVIQWALQLCDALGYLHDRGYVYSGLSPKSLGTFDDRDSGSVVLCSKTLKRIGIDRWENAAGTQFDAPETAISTEKVAETGDIYSLCAILFQLVTGYSPSSFEKEPHLPSIKRIIPSVSKGLDAIIRKGTMSNKEERYQSCAELRIDLERLVKKKRRLLKVKQYLRLS